MYKRRVRLEATSVTTGEKVFETLDHRITFNIEVGMAQGLATSTIILYNLSDQEVKRLTNADLDAGSLGDGTENKDLNKIRVKLYAGYEDEINERLDEEQLIIDGYVMNSTSLKKLPNRLTYLYIIAFGSNLLINKFESFETPSGTKPKGEQWDLRKVINTIVTSAGYDANAVDYTAVQEELVGEPTKMALAGRTFKNNEQGMFKILDELSEEFCFSWSVRADGIGIFPKLNDSEQDSSEFNYLQKNGTRFEIDPVKVKGTPVAGMATLEIPHKLDATLFPGTVIDVGEINGNGDNDSLPDNGIIDYSALGQAIFYTNDVSRYAVFQYYMIWKIMHKGDTHGDDWSSTLICKVPSSGITGNGELDG